MIRQITCKDCGRKFSFSENQQRSYAEKGFCEPKRCAECKKEMAKKRESPYYGWEEAMTNRVALRKRKTRVHYSPHIVGGFR